jgi:lysophospholipid hydrolase
MQGQSLPTNSRENVSLNRAHSSRHAVQAGDLHTSAGLNDPYRASYRAFSAANSGLRTSRSFTVLPGVGEEGQRMGGEDFDLKEEVMACIAKSIGLHQPPISESESRQTSPAFSAVGSRSGDGREQNVFTSFQSLSLLETADDTSSVTGDSTAVSSHGLGALDNEVEILYFSSGSTLARSGERHPGTFTILLT